MNYHMNGDENDLNDVLKFFKDSEITNPTPREITEALEKIIPKVGEILLKNLKEKMKKPLKKYRKIVKGFNKRLMKRYRESIDLFEAYIWYLYELGARFNDINREIAAKNNDYVFDVLTKLHARGCQVAFEILSLLKRI